MKQVYQSIREIEGKKLYLVEQHSYAGWSKYYLRSAEVDDKAVYLLEIRDGKALPLKQVGIWG
jgi:hypothetical protein